MPELPETETIARDLHAAVAGTHILEVSVDRGDVLRGCTPSTLSERLRGLRIDRVWRRAKCVLLSCGGDRHLAVTPRFTGALILETSPTTDPYACVRLRLDDGRTLRYTDVRRLGTVALFDTGGLEAWSASLGPEPLDPAFTPERLSESIRATNRAVKAVLMDQKRLAGVGNIYANEALWGAGIRPARRAASLTRRECEALHHALTTVLHAAIAARGTSFRDYRDAFGARGSFATQLQAYGRGGAPCRRCGTTLTSSHAIDGRATVWCRACQR